MIEVKKKQILAIVTCFNRKKSTINSIEKLIKGNLDTDFKFIVVDDNSDDGTKVELERCFNNVMILSGNGNLFYSGGMRKGINYAKQQNCKYDYILFFNDDVDFYSEIISRMIEFSNGSDEIIVGVTKNSIGALSYGGVKKTSNFLPRFKIIMSGSSKRYCDTFNANCVLIPYHIFINLENIDPIYIHSLGDYDYGLNASKQGYKILATNFFVGLCENNSVTENWLDTKKTRLKRLKEKENVKGLPRKIWYYFLKKNYGTITAIVYSISQYIKILLGK